MTNSNPRCACGLYEIEVELQGQTRQVGTGCKWNCDTPTATFLRGHDAKLKSFLIKAGIAGKSVIFVGNGGAQEVLTAVGAGNRYGFGHMVADGIQNAMNRKTKAAEKRAAKKAAKVALVIEGDEDPIDASKPDDKVFVKIGRWTYDVVSQEQVDEDTVRVTYLTKQGEEKTTEVANFAIITA